MEQGSTLCGATGSVLPKNYTHRTRKTAQTWTGGLQRTIAIRPSRLHFAGTSRTRSSISKWTDTFASWKDVRLCRCLTCAVFVYARTLFIGEAPKLQESCLTRMLLIFLYSHIVLMLFLINNKIEMMFVLVTVSSVGLWCQGYGQRTGSYDPA